MIVIVAFAVGLLILLAASAAVMPIDGAFDKSRSDILRNDMSALIEAIVEQHGHDPIGNYLTPSQIVSVAGYEHLRSRGGERFQSQFAAGLNNGVWRFNRLAVWFESPHDYVGNASYLSAANNTCGVGAFAASTSWCGRSQSIWSKIENQNDYGDLILSEKQRLYRTISKFYQRFNADGSFSTLPNGSIVTMPQLVGYSGTAAACGGAYYMHGGIPFSCTDLFNAWGIPIVLNKRTDAWIALVNRTPILNSAGQPVRIAEEARLE